MSKNRFQALLYQATPSPGSPAGLLLLPRRLDRWRVYAHGGISYCSLILGTQSISNHQKKHESKVEQS